MSLPWIKDYLGQTLINVLVTAKIDGVCGITDGTSWTSRANKPLYNLPTAAPGEYEIFLGDWSKSVSAARTQINGSLISHSSLYSLRPIDPRLVIARQQNITVNEAKEWLNIAIAKGYEGIVFHCEGLGYRLKPMKTMDVVVTGYQPGKGKHEGRLGAILTQFGKVGTGFSDMERELFTPEFIVSKLVEIEFTKLTEKGKLREPRFRRLREDK